MWQIAPCFPIAFIKRVMIDVFIVHFHELAKNMPIKLRKDLGLDEKNSLRFLTSDKKKQLIKLTIQFPKIRLPNKETAKI